MSGQEDEEDSLVYEALLPVTLAFLDIITGHRNCVAAPRFSPNALRASALDSLKTSDERFGFDYL